MQTMTMVDGNARFGKTPTPPVGQVANLFQKFGGLSE
jgi:hypothetical protein